MRTKLQYRDLILHVVIKENDFLTFSFGLNLNKVSSKFINLKKKKRI